MVLARSEKYNPFPSPTALRALCFTPLRTITALVTCVRTATYPTLSVRGWSCAIRLQPSHLFQHGNKRKEVRHTTLKVNFRERPSVPTHFTVPDHESKLQSKLRSEIKSFPPPPACGVQGSVSLATKKSITTASSLANGIRKCVIFFSLVSFITRQ